MSTEWHSNAAAKRMARKFVPCAAVLTLFLFVFLSVVRSVNSLLVFDQIYERSAAFCAMLTVLYIIYTIALRDATRKVASLAVCVSLFLVLSVVLIVYSTTAGNAALWLCQAGVLALLIPYSGIPLEFKVSNEYTAISIIAVGGIITVYAQIRSNRSWEHMIDTSTKYGDNKVKMAVILSELLPGDLISTLRRMDVTKWHEISKTHDSVAVVFVSIKNLPELVHMLKPGDLVTVLHTVFSTCDRLLRNHNNKPMVDLTKIETVEGTYLCCSGLSLHSRRYVFNAYSFATEAVGALNNLSIDKMIASDQNQDLVLEVAGGVAVGPILAGVVGSFPRYCIFGTTVNTAARLEQHAEPGTVMVTDDVLSRTMDVDICDFNTPNLIGEVPVTVTKSTTTTTTSVQSVVIGYGQRLDPGSRTESIVLKFKSRLATIVRAKGIGETVSYVLESCAPYTISLPVERTDKLSHTMSSNNTELTRTKSINIPSNSRGYYAARSSQLMGGIVLSHMLVMACYAFYGLLSWSHVSQMERATYVFFAVSHGIAPLLYKMVVGTRWALPTSCCVVAWIVGLLVLDVIGTGEKFSDLHSDPAFYIGFDCELIAQLLAVFFIIYRLPVGISSAIVFTFALADSLVMYIVFYSTFYVIIRFSFVVFVGYISISLAESLRSIDWDLYRKEQQCLYVMNEVNSLLVRLLPQHAVALLSADDSNSTCGRSHYASSSSSLSPVSVSPLVRPVGGQQSTSRWQKYENLVVFQSDIVGFSSSVLSMLTSPVEFFGIIRQLYSMMDECAEENGLWKMYTIGDAYIAVSGYEKTKSADDAAYYAVKFARDVLKRLKEVNARCHKMGYPEISLRVGLAAGSAVTAIVGEYHPSFLIWGSAPDRASEMEHTSCRDGILVHPSVITLGTKLIDHYEFSGSPFGAILTDEQVAYVVKAGRPLYLKSKDQM